jgi:hypothetical protein
MDGTEIKRTLKLHQLIGSIYADTRFPPGRQSARCDVRSLALAMAWVIAEQHGGQIWPRVHEILHLDNRSFLWVIRQDVPRYEPPRVDPGCAAPMIRREGTCGNPRTCTGFRVTDPADGTWQIVNFCRHHEDYACQVHAEERRRQGSSLPEPAPNAGGLLPCYFPWRAWEQTYRDAEPGWKVPALGIKADDWPVLAKVTAAEPPKLIALDGKGESVAGMPRGDAPSLRLIRQTP